MYCMLILIEINDAKVCVYTYLIQITLIMFIKLISDNLDIFLTRAINQNEFSDVDIVLLVTLVEKMTVINPRKVYREAREIS